MDIITLIFLIIDITRKIDGNNFCLHTLIFFLYKLLLATIYASWNYARSRPYANGKMSLYLIVKIIYPAQCDEDGFSDCLLNKAVAAVLFLHSLKFPSEDSDFYYLMLRAMKNIRMKSTVPSACECNMTKRYIKKDDVKL